MNYFLSDSGLRIPIISDISIRMISPLFERKNTYTYPLTFYATPDIDILFERARLVDSKNNKVREIDGELRIDKLRFTGILRISKISDEKYSGNFTGQGAINKRLTDLVMNEMDFGSGEIFDHNTSSFYNYEDFIFQINNEDAFCFLPYINNSYTENFGFTYETISGIINRFTTNRYFQPILTPSFLLKWILDQLFNLVGIKLNENALESSKYNGLMLFSNYSDINLEFTEKTVAGAIVTFSAITKNEDSVSLHVSDITISISNTSYIKLYDLAGSQFNCEGRIFEIVSRDSTNNLVEIKVDPEIFDTSTSGKFICLDSDWNYPDEFEVKNHLPRITVMEFLEAVNSITGTISIFDESSDTCRIIGFNDIINRIKSTDITTYCGKIQSMELNEFDGFSLKFEGTFDSWYSERVNELKTDYNLKDPVASITNLPMNAEHNDVRLVRDKQQYFIWERSPWGSRQTYNEVNVYLGNWRFISENFIAKSQDNEDLKIEISASPIVNDITRTAFTQNKIIPRMDIPLNTDETTELTEWGVRLMFFTELTDDYPLAKVENSEFSLRINDTNGIYETLYQDWIEWKLNRARDITIPVQWPVRLLNSFKWEEKYKIWNTNYLVKEIKFKVKPDGRIHFEDTILVRT